MLKKLKALFVEEDESTASNDGISQKKSGGNVDEKAYAKTEPSIDASSAGTERPSKKFIEVLLGALDKNNLKGFDYLEFKQSLQSLAKMPMDEATKYQSAFAMAQTMGATPEKIGSNGRTLPASVD